MDKKISYKHICCEDTYMFNYTQLPDELFTIKIFADLSLEAKVLYSFMLRRVSISKENSFSFKSGPELNATKYFRSGDRVGAVSYLSIFAIKRNM